MNYDQEIYEGNCYISYKEKETLYKVKTDITGPYSNVKYDELTRKYKKYDYKLLTKTPECEEYMEDKKNEYLQGERFGQFSYYHESKDTSINSDYYFNLYRVFLLDFMGIPTQRIETKVPIQVEYTFSESSSDNNEEPKDITIKGKAFQLFHKMLKKLKIA